MLYSLCLLSFLCVAIRSQILANLTYDILFPFPRGARENVDPLEAFGGIDNVVIGDQTLYPSELADGGNISWSQATSDSNGYVSLSTSNVNWALIQSNLGSAANPTQGWARTTFSIPQASVYYIQCMGMTSFFIDGTEFRGDGYSYGYWILPVSLELGDHVLLVRLIRSTFQCQFINRPGIPEEANQLMYTLQGNPYGPIIVPDIVLSSEPNPVATLAGGYLSFGLVNAGNSPTTSPSLSVLTATQDGRPVSIDFDPDGTWFPAILPRQPFPIHGRLRLNGNLESNSSVDLTVRISATIDSAQQSITHNVTLRCRSFPQNSYAFTFPDYDGTIQYAGVIPPVNPCGTRARTVPLATLGQIESSSSVSADALASTCFSGPSTLEGENQNCSNIPDTTLKSVFSQNFEAQQAQTETQAESEGTLCSVLLSTHGAGVDAAGDPWTGSYYPQQNAWVLLPTGRRDYGYDWQGPGRVNAISTLEYFAANLPGVPDALKDSYRIQRDRILWGGHSMGGHGCLVLSSGYSDYSLGACCAAAWIKMWQYSPYFVNHGTSFSDPQLRGIVDSAFTEYDTDLFAVHQKNIPFIGRTGSVDQSVIPWNLRRFIRVVDQESSNPAAAKLSEVPGQGHWFDGVVDDAELQPWYDAQINQDYKPPLPPQYTVRAVNLWGTGKGGVKILQQYFPFQLSSIQLSYQRSQNIWTLQTQNVRRFSVNKMTNFNPLQAPPYTASSLIIDGQTFVSPSLSDPAVAYFCALKEVQIWSLCDPDEDWKRVEKSEGRNGPLRNIFETGPVTFVYGTKDNNGPWRRDRAWLMASTMFYQGRWGALILADTDEFDFASGSNLILLGGPYENRLSERLFSQTSMFTSGSIRFLEGGSGGGHGFQVGPQVFDSAGIGLVSFGIYPNGSSPALLVLIAGTNISGELDAMSLLPLQSGIQSADFVVTSPSFKWRGIGGLLMTGYWSYDFSYRNELSYPRTFSDATCADSSDSMKLSRAQTVGVFVSSVLGALLLGLVVGTFWCSKFYFAKIEKEYMAVE